MNIYSALSLLAFYIYFLSGIYFYRSYKNSKIRELFVFFCFIMAIWSFSYTFVYYPSNYSTAFFKISAIGWCTSSAVILNMAFKYTESKLIEYKIIKILIYLPALVFLFMEYVLFWSNRFPNEFIEKFFYVGDFIYDTSYILLAIIMFFRWGKLSQNRTNKKISRIIVISSTIPFILNLLTQTIIPLITGVSFPNISQIYTLIIMVGIYFASTQYDLFGVPYKLILDEMLPEMMDMFFLLTPEGKISNINKRTENLLGYRKEELLDVEFVKLLDNKERAYELWRSNSDINKSSEIVLIKNGGERMPAYLSCSTVYNKNYKTIMASIIIGQDITLQKELEQEIKIQRETEEKLRESEEKFRVIFSKHSAMMMLIDPDTHGIFLANEAAQKFYGYSEAEFSKLVITDLDEYRPSQVNDVIEKIMKNDENILNLKHRLSSGELRDVEVHATSIKFTEKMLIFSIIHDITQRKREEEYIIHLAYHDGLTDLYNHKFFYERLQQETARAGRYNNKFAVMYIDMDKFKEINDNYGHGFGDQVLVQVARRIISCIRGSDIAARIGGDEFALLILDIQSNEEVEIVKRKLLEVFKIPLVNDQTKLNISASIGSSIYPDNGGNADHLIKVADREMYKMKNN